MSFKYSTREFIKEMQYRPCLWNVNTAEYNDRVAREKAWVEIARIMYDDWSDSESHVKSEKVKDLQKKWKGLRDYFTRVKNKKLPSRNESELQRNRKRPFLDMLYFLNAKTSKPGHGNRNQPAETNSGRTIVKHNNSLLASMQNSPGPSRAPAPAQPSTRETSEIQLSDPDTNFLLSILPDMKSMNQAQNFEFRFQVMTLIKNMKYQQNDDYYVYCAQEQSTFPQSSTQNQDQETDPISNESEALSPEDIKIILHDSPNSSPSK